MSEPYSLLIVGGGPAGLSAARSFRAAGQSGPVVIVSDEHRMPYQRPPLSKELLREEIEESALDLEGEQWLEEQSVSLIGARAVALDPDARRLTLSGGRTLDYRICLLATGAEPIRPPVPGADHPGVRTLRSLEDLRELKRRLTPGAAVVVIGSGFIGCEIAASLRRLGHPVTLISDEPAPNLARLGESSATRIRGWLEELGIELALGTAVDAIERSGDGLQVSAGERRFGADVVVMATGVSPRAELAALAGATLESGAIVADAQLRTTLDGVLAAGDACAAFNTTAGRRLRVEHWGDALAQGELAGRTAAGDEASWGEVPGFWSTVGEHTLKYAAWGDGFSEVRFEAGADGAFSCWYGDEGRVVGVLAHDDDEAYERGRRLIEAGAAWT